ncbi:cation:proton antiporter [Corynebacterium pygosceleis]|uniref:Cation:proton antiporter n=1 Tax=Corynebacterium pygosceleis TaxID=2800406 RepID=A0A9Q4C7V2_9CORY|nr:cation:proton antiporter [Corynebacterium pygosceleis]MCK7637354.1 cation:proton antiporter [Corynebacterium pygosceleis]MCK7676004.1 cation:proton antiporter [Corynebacterium pygosceleis]MCX7445258.1 cation:proton antiporter [Corynebacterium pygosceleis]MCX7468317.1 cation:proton antiporter [Corynebacterium pygosceleis]
MSALTVVVAVSVVMMTLALLASLALLLKNGEDTTRAVLADKVFYTMIAIFVTWTFINPTSISYEIPLLAGLLGLLTTVSLARILSKGRR